MKLSTGYPQVIHRPSVSFHSTVVSKVIHISTDSTTTIVNIVRRGK